MVSSTAVQERIWNALSEFSIELPSWGFANTGTRFGKFLQPAAASTIEEKFSDAAQVHSLTGATPTIALHVLWDLPNGLADIAEIRAHEKRFGIRAGSINPNLFQDQDYKFGSIANPSEEIRARAQEHLIESVQIAKALRSKYISLWVADGSNYPGSQSIRRRIDWVMEALRKTHDALAADQQLLVEYKPFEPAFYHTDIADWGMALEFARSAGKQAKVLVDTGHHYQAQNIEQIVAWLLHLKMLGGFHFNDRRYADDDLTMGSIDPYQVFRIFHEIQHQHWLQSSQPPVAFMIDQSHNLKGKMEAMVQTVTTAQEMVAKCALVDQEELARLQDACNLLDAEECLRSAFWEDVRPVIREWRTARGLPPAPLLALRSNGYLEEITGKRRARNEKAVTSYA